MVQRVAHRGYPRVSGEAGVRKNGFASLVDERVWLSYKADIASSHGLVPPRQLPRHRRVLPVRPHLVGIGDEQRQPSRTLRQRSLQELFLPFGGVGERRLSEEVRPGAEEREEASREHKVRLRHRRRHLAAGAHVLLVVLAVAENEAAHAQPVEGWPSLVGAQRLPHEISRSDGGERRAEPHRFQTRERVLPAAGGVGDDDDLLPRLVEPLERVHRAGIGLLAIVNHSELIEQKRVILIEQRSEAPQRGRARAESAHSSRSEERS
mmetsp:Transcript_1514/g.3858  ORF Transcript_1514/g.3858 Transcript_1514/m.3858 type:complete len:265 (+) Transcript_1514:495-1289(+)